MEKQKMIIYKFSWLVVIAKKLGFRSIEFSTSDDSPIKACPQKSMDNRELFLYVVGYHLTRLFGTMAYICPTFLVLRLFMNAQVREMIEVYKSFLREAGIHKTSYSLLSDAVSDIFAMINDDYQEVDNIFQSLLAERDGSVKIILNKNRRAIPHL